MKNVRIHCQFVHHYQKNLYMDDLWSQCGIYTCTLRYNRIMFIKCSTISIEI